MEQHYILSCDGKDGRGKLPSITREDGLVLAKLKSINVLVVRAL